MDNFRVAYLIFLCLYFTVSCWIFKTASSSSVVLWSTYNNSTSLHVQTLTTAVSNLVLLQRRYDRYKTTEIMHHPTVVTISQDDTWTWAKRIQDLLTNSQNGVVFRSQLLDVVIREDDKNFDQILSLLHNQLSHIRAIVVVVKDLNALSALSQAVCSATQFKWTNLLHSVQWVMATTDIDSDASLIINYFCFDFVTLISSSAKSVCISRKARGVNSVLVNVTICKEQWSETDLLREFRDLTKPKVFGLEAMNLPVGILVNVKKYVESIESGNVTTLDGYVIDVLNLLAVALKFKYTLVTPTDALEYGAAESDGSGNGLTGMIIRREAAFSCMGFARTEGRLKAIDYADTPVLWMPIYITYRLSDENHQVDMTLFSIVQLQFFFLFLGVAFLLAFLGTLTHTATNSCSLKAPTKATRWDLRRVTSFPEHICFHNDGIYINQTGRVLRGSWAVFWFIISVTYSAYLVTSFTVKTKELQIDSMEKLLSYPQYRIGFTQLHSALPTYLKTSPDKIAKRIWEKILLLNKTDPTITSPDIKLHMLRVLEGNYAFIDITNVDDIPLFTGVYSGVEHVRSYQLPFFKSLEGAHLILPKNSFYKEMINEVLMTLDELGILRYLQKNRLINRPLSKPTTNSVQRDGTVHLSRVLILIYVTLSGIGAALLSLILEHVWVNIIKRLTSRKL